MRAVDCDQKVAFTDCVFAALVKLSGYRQQSFVAHVASISHGFHSMINIAGNTHIYRISLYLQHEIRLMDI
jgi:hypothetical protein